MFYHAVTLDGDLRRVFLVPVSDVHLGAPGFDEKGFRRLVEWIAGTPEAYCVLNGDLFEAATKTSLGDVYTTKMNPGEELKWLRSALGPIKNKVLCVNIGNHEERVCRQDGVDLAETLAYELGAFYSREGCLLKLAFGRRHNGKPVVYTLYITHGFGSGKQPGSKLNNLQRLALSVMADVYIIGHGHSETVFKDRWFVPDTRNNKIEERQRVFVQTGSFLNWQGYAERQGYVPGSQEMPIIELDGVEKGIRVVV